MPVSPQEIILQAAQTPLQLLTEDSQSFKELQQAINYLIRNDFPLLIQVLYRIDVAEARLKETVASHPGEDAGKLIAILIIERLQQKAISRQLFKQQGEIPEDEKW